MSATTDAPLARALRNAGYLLMGKGVGAVLGLATTAIAARALGLQSYGVLIPAIVAASAAFWQRPVPD